MFLDTTEYKKTIKYSDFSVKESNTSGEELHQGKDSPFEDIDIVEDDWLITENDEILIDDKNISRTSLAFHHSYESAEQDAHWGTIQKWHGKVLSILESSFTVRLVPLVGDPDVFDADISFSKVDPEDVELIVPGAELYWSIVSKEKPGQVNTISIIRFRRLPRLTRKVLEEAKEIGKQIGDLIYGG